LTTEQVYLQLTEIFHDQFDDDCIVLTAETTAADIDGWDSFNHVNLLLAIEVKFGIKFRTAETESLYNVGHLVQIIQTKLGQKR
jgi:acyl carrier protein